MQTFEKICILILTPLLAVFNPFFSYVAYSTEGEPIVVEEAEYCFDNDRLLIGAYNFGNTADDAPLVEAAKDAGLDFIITSNKSEDFLNACDENELGVILSGSSVLPSSYWEVSDSAYDAWTNITSERYYSATENNHKCIWGNDIIDEPTSEQFLRIEDMVRAYSENVPGKLPLVNLFPLGVEADRLGNDVSFRYLRSWNPIHMVDWLNYDLGRYKCHVSDYINTISTDYISFDVYPLEGEYNEDGELVKSTKKDWLRNLDIIGDACRTTNRDFWVITQAAGCIDEGRRYCDTPEDIRWQAYVSLSFGADAIIHANYYTGWWDSDSHMIDANKNKTDTYYAVQTVNKELAAFSDIYGQYDDNGAFLVNGKEAAGNYTNYINAPSVLYRPSVTSEDPILTGSFSAKEGSGKAYTFVNMYEPETGKTAQAEISFPGASEITVYKKGVAQTVSGDKLSLDLENGEGVFVTVQFKGLTPVC